MTIAVGVPCSQCHYCGACPVLPVSPLQWVSPSRCLSRAPGVTITVPVLCSRCHHHGGCHHRGACPVLLARFPGHISPGVDPMLQAGLLVCAGTSPWGTLSPWSLTCQPYLCGALCFLRASQSLLGPSREVVNCWCGGVGGAAREGAAERQQHALQVRGKGVNYCKPDLRTCCPCYIRLFFSSKNMRPLGWL